MSYLEEAIVLGLAAWRATALLSYERGPFSLFLGVRRLFRIRHDEKGEPTSWSANVVTEGLTCPWCLGIYAAAAMYGLWQLEPRVVLVIAASSVVVVVERWARP